MGYLKAWRQNLPTLAVAAVVVVAVVVSLIVWPHRMRCRFECGPPRGATKVTLTGGIRFSGNVPAGYTDKGYQRGLVRIVRSDHGVVASMHVAQGQGYEFELLPGTYTIETPGNAPAGSGYPPCTRTVTIRSERTVHADVYCDFH